MTTQVRAFRSLADTQSVAVLTSNTAITLNYTNGTRALRVCNVGTQVVFINFNAAGSLATGIPIPAGQTEVFTIPNDVTSVGTIANATGSNLYTTVGEGI